MEKVFALPISEHKRLVFLWRKIKEWYRGSLLILPILYLLGSLLLVFITRQVDIYLMENVSIPAWWMAKATIGIPIASLVSSSVLSFLAIVFSISLVALQMANSQYSPQVISIFNRASTTKIALSLFIATFVYSFSLMIELSRTHYERITIVSLLTNVVLIFACLIVFIVYMQSIMFLIRVTRIIDKVTESTRESIESNLPLEGEYVECPAIILEQPCQVIHYSNIPSTLLIKRNSQGVLQALEYENLVQIATKYGCVFRVLPSHGDYINEGDAVFEVYGESKIQPEQVLREIVVKPEREVFQDPSFGIRILVDIALQALSPAVNAPTIAHQVILRLTNLLALIARRPQNSGTFADEKGQIRLLVHMPTWEDYVELAFNEIYYYGKDDPQTRKSLTEAYDYLLQKVTEAFKPPIERQKAYLSGSQD